MAHQEGLDGSSRGYGRGGADMLTLSLQGPGSSGQVSILSERQVGTLLRPACEL